ncbi:MAG: hypothetical protein AAFQ80_06875 [Cyanobacteria bacterium J06621_8]
MLNASLSLGYARVSRACRTKLLTILSESSQRREAMQRVAGVLPVVATASRRDNSS